MKLFVWLARDLSFSCSFEEAIDKEKRLTRSTNMVTTYEPRARNIITKIGQIPL